MRSKPHLSARHVIAFTKLLILYFLSKIVKKLCKRDDISMLYKMFENLNEVESGNKTLDNVELNLGEDLAQSYLYPCLKK